MSKELLHELIDMVPENDTDVIYRLLIKFIPTDVASDDEVIAIAEAHESLKKDGHVSFDDIDWD